MRSLVIASVCAFASACATPTLTYTAAMPNGNIEGRQVISVPLAYVEIVPPEAPAARQPAGTPAGPAASRSAAPAAPAAAEAEAPAATPPVQGAPQPANAPRFIVSYTPNPNATFAVTPEDSLLALTEIAPNYGPNTSVPSTMDVTTHDRSADLARTVAGVIALGGDPTFLARAPADQGGGQEQTIGCDFIAPEWMNTVVPRTSGDPPQAMREASQAFGAHWDPRRCFIQAELGAIPDDAVPISYFRREIAGRPSHVVIGAACRRVTLTYVAGPTTTTTGASFTGTPGMRLINVGTSRSFRWVGFLPDPNFIRLTPLPRKGKLDMANTCSPPNLTREGNPPTFFDQVMGIFRPFQNGGGGGTAASQGGGS